MPDSNSSTMIFLGMGEALLSNQKVSGWTVYLTTHRLVLYNNIGFGDDIKVLDAQCQDILSIVCHKENPWPFYALGALFCLSSLKSQKNGGRKIFSSLSFDLQLVIE